MLVVRSQDKKKLVVDDVIYVTNDYYGNGWNVYCDKVSCQEGFIIATYSTERKVLKVLDMLEAFVNNDYEKLHDLGYKGCILVAQNYGTKEYKLNPLSFQFPQDYEVE